MLTEKYVLMVVTGIDRQDHCRVVFHDFLTEVAAQKAKLALQQVMPVQFGVSVRAVVIED